MPDLIARRDLGGFLVETVSDRAKEHFRFRYLPEPGNPNIYAFPPTIKEDFNESVGIWTELGFFTNLTISLIEEE